MCMSCGRPTSCISGSWVGVGIYLSTRLDDFSSYSIAWKLTSTMNATDVQETLLMALDKTGLDHVLVDHRPRLLSDNGSCYVSKELKDFLERKHIEHTHSALYHPMTQGKIERYHQSMKNIVSLQIIFFREILNLRLPVSWPITTERSSPFAITNAITSHWIISHRPMSILAKPRRCFQNETKSRKEPYNKDVYKICKLHQYNHYKRTGKLHLSNLTHVSNYL